MTRRFDKRQIAVIAILIVAAGRTLWFKSRLLGVMPDGSDPRLLMFATVAWTFEWTAIMVAMSMTGSMLADVTDEHELRTARRQEGLIFSASAFLCQTTTGLGSFAAGIVLQLSGFSTSQSGRRPDPELGWRLGLFSMIFVVAFCATAGWSFSRYSLSRARHNEILLRLGRPTPALTQ